MAGAGQVGAALALYWRAQPTVRYAVRYAGRLFPACWALVTADLRCHPAPHEAVCYRLFSGAAGGLFIGLIAWWGLPMG